MKYREIKKDDRKANDDMTTINSVIELQIILALSDDLWNVC